jgi:sulfite reductase alpha subunit-like flavoprotein
MEGRFESRNDSQHRYHILIGAGTGIAPLRSIIHEKQVANTEDLGTLLIFGSRSATAEFFEQEWAAMNAPPTKNLQVITAFTRD